MPALQENGRYTVQELAARIGLSTSPTWRRLKSLEQRGVIKDYVARIDASRIGYHDTVFAHVTLSQRIGCCLMAHSTGDTEIGHPIIQCTCANFLISHRTQVINIQPRIAYFGI